MRRVTGTIEDDAGGQSVPPSRRLTLIACAGRLETALGRFAAGRCSVPIAIQAARGS